MKQNWRDWLGDVLGFRAYYAAAKVNRLTGHIASSYAAQSPNVPIYTDARLIIERIRQAKRDHPIIKGAIRDLVNNVLPTPIQVEPDVYFERTQKPAALVTSALEVAWKRWIQGDCDFDGWASHRKSFSQIQKMVLRAVVSDGEVFVIRRRRAARDGSVMLQLEVAETDRLGNTIITGGDRRSGIEYDSQNRPVRYHFRKSLRVEDWNTEPIDAKDVLHVMIPDRPQMDVGDLALACVLNSARDLGEYVDNELEIKALLSRVAGILTSPQDLAGSVVAGTNSSGAAVRELPMEKASIWELPSGEFKELGTSRPGAQFEAFVTVVQRFIARGMGLPYEVIAGDWTKTTYSGGRMAWQQAQPHLIDFRDMLSTQLIVPAYEWFVAEAIMGVRAPLAGIANVAQHRLRVPGYRYIDPQKEIAAETLALEQGLKSPQQIAAEHGDDWFETIDQIAEAKAYAEARGVTLAWATPKPAAPTVPTPDDAAANPQEVGADATE